MCWSRASGEPPAVIDLLLYQALVDSLVEAIEASLGPRDRLFAYRQAPIEESNQFEGSPKWSDFNEATKAMLEDEPTAFAVKADIAGYLGVATDELERLLIERGAGGSRTRDLRELLDAWQALGVRGLPKAFRLRRGEYPAGFKPLLRKIYMELRAGGRPDVIGDVGEILGRFPDLTG